MMLKLSRSLAFGVLAAAGAYCVGFVAARLGHELYPWAGPVFDVLVPGSAAIAFAAGTIYSYYSRDQKLRNLVVAITLIVTLTGFSATAVRLIDEHHDRVLTQEKERWRTMARVVWRVSRENSNCGWKLFEERLATTGEITPSDVALVRRYCYGATGEVEEEARDGARTF